MTISLKHNLQFVFYFQNINTKKGKPIFSSSKQAIALNVEDLFFPQTIQRQVKWSKTRVNNSFASLWFSHAEADRMTTHRLDILPMFVIFSCNKSLTNSSQRSNVFHKRWLGYHGTMRAFHKNETWAKTWWGCTSPGDLPHETVLLRVCQTGETCVPFVHSPLNIYNFSWQGDCLEYRG